MLSSLFSTVVKGLPGVGSRRTVSRSDRPNPRSTSPTLELLEDRCVLSAVTTLPSATDVLNPLTVPLDILLASMPKGDPHVVFLGDSITAGYAAGTGMPVWSAFLAPLGAVDYGVGNQTTQTLLYQLSLGQLIGIDPSVVVLTIGTNNLLEGDSPSATAAGILANVNAIHHYLPEAQVLVLGTPPGNPSPNDPFRIQTEQTDALVDRMLAGDSHAVFVNIAPALEQPDGTISNLVMFDYIHPTELGYFDMALALIPPIEQASLLSNSRMEASLWNGLFGEAALSFHFSSRAGATVSSGLRALIY
jgi:beta-glucosidase